MTASAKNMFILNMASPRPTAGTYAPNGRRAKEDLGMTSAIVAAPSSLIQVAAVRPTLVSSGTDKAVPFNAPELVSQTASFLMPTPS